MERKEKFERFQVAMQNINRNIRGGFFEPGGHPVTRVQWLIMQILWRKGDCAIGELADQMDVRPSTMSQMLDRLEKFDFTKRIPNPADSRSRLVTLTDEGRTLIHRVQSSWMQKLNEPLEQMSEEEQIALIHLLEKLSKQFPKRND
ncbi:MAG: MarR family winged helix-turn-helix transcriptional regulator [Bacilli bacterium]